MDTSSSFSTLQSLFNNLEMEKELFRLENKHLPPDELQRQWSDKTAQLSSVLSLNAPVLDLEAHGQREMQQMSTVPRVIPAIARPASVWFPSSPAGHSGLTVALGQPLHLRP